MVRLLSWATATLPAALMRDGYGNYALPFEEFQRRLKDALGQAGVPSAWDLGIMTLPWKETKK